MDHEPEPYAPVLREARPGVTTRHGLYGPAGRVGLLPPTGSCGSVVGLALSYVPAGVGAGHADGHKPVRGPPALRGRCAHSPNRRPGTPAVADRLPERRPAPVLPVRDRPRH